MTIIKYGNEYSTNNEEIKSHYLKEYIKYPPNKLEEILRDAIVVYIECANDELVDVTTLPCCLVMIAKNANLPCLPNCVYLRAKRSSLWWTFMTPYVIYLELLHTEILNNFELDFCRIANLSTEPYI